MALGGVNVDAPHEPFLEVRGQRQAEAPPTEKSIRALIYDLDDPPRLPINQHRLIVDNCVWIASNVVLRRQIVIWNTGRRQDHARLHILVVGIGRVMLEYNVFVKSRPLVNAERSVDAARNAADKTPATPRRARPLRSLARHLRRRPLCLER